MKIAVTGSNGFIGKNLCLFLHELNYQVIEINRNTLEKDLIHNLCEADFIFHMAGINRPKNVIEFESGNIDLTRFIIETLSSNNKKTPLVLASSTQVDSKNEYGMSKLVCEELVSKYTIETGAHSYIYRLPNVFGKWCKPNYNSFIATFCYNILNGIDITINDSDAQINLVYIDDVCDSFIKLLNGNTQSGFQKISTEYKTTVGEVANIISSFKYSRSSLTSGPVGIGLTRALYSTYLSYMQPEDFNYKIDSHADDRGVFCEMLKTIDSGQFSFFTAHPGITRGGHYHHTKNEKFLVIKGDAKFKFEHVITGKKYQLRTSGLIPEVVETIPGWSHDITNIGDEELVVMLWANEVFDREHPDTIAKELF